MKKGYLGLIAALLTVCAVGMSLLQWEAVYGGLQSCDAKVQTPPSLTAALTDEQLEKEWALARWYNLSLREETAGEAPLGAYETLLDFGAGKMGYLELPEQGVFLPIVHESETEENRAVHCFGTDLPIGGRGNCPVLRCEGISLSVGEIFRIHILNMVLTYEVTVTGSTLPVNTQGEDLCVLALSPDSETATGVRMENPSQMN